VITVYNAYCLFELYICHACFCLILLLYFIVIIMYFYRFAVNTVAPCRSVYYCACTLFSRSNLHVAGESFSTCKSSRPRGRDESSVQSKTYYALQIKLFRGKL